MLVTHPACFFKETTGYAVVFPGLDNLSTCGDTLDEAISMAIDCLAGYLFLLDVEGEAKPLPLSANDISMEDVSMAIYENPSDYTEAFINLISVDVEEYAKIHFMKSVKKTLTIPEWMNKKALDLDINFSQVLQEALLAKFRMMN